MAERFHKKLSHVVPSNVPLSSGAIAKIAGKKSDQHALSALHLPSEVAEGSSLRNLPAGSRDVQQTHPALIAVVNKISARASSGKEVMPSSRLTAETHIRPPVAIHAGNINNSEPNTIDNAGPLAADRGASPRFTYRIGAAAAAGCAGVACRGPG